MAKRFKTIEQQLAYLNAPSKPARKLAPQRVMGRELVPDAARGVVAVLFNGAEIGTRPTVAEAQVLACDHACGRV